VVAEISQVLNERVNAAEAAGIYRWNIIIDPGIGFAKARVLNLQVLRRLSEVKQNCHGLPLLVSCNTFINCKSGAQRLTVYRGQRPLVSRWDRRARGSSERSAGVRTPRTARGARRPPAVLPSPKAPTFCACTTRPRWWTWPRCRTRSGELSGYPSTRDQKYGLHAGQIEAKACPST